MMIYVTRHGQPWQPDADLADQDAQYPRGDPPLSELGRLQARKLGERLGREQFAGTILASPYRRTAETADVVAQVLGLPFHPEPAIREYTGSNIHDFAGLNLRQLRALFPRLADDADLSYPWWTTQAEDLGDDGYRPAVVDRVGRLLQSLMAPAGPDVLLVGHGASAGAVVHYLYQRKTRGEFRQSGSMWNCALSAFDLDDAGLVPLYNGDTSHLGADEVTANSRFINHPSAVGD